MAEKREHYLIEDIFRRNFTVMLVAMLTGMICVVVDSVLTGQFLGKDAVAAVGLITPATSVLMGIISLFSTGIGQLCTRSMGKADIDQVNRIFSTLVCCTAALSAITGVVLFAFAPGIAHMLGSAADAAVIVPAGDYLRGYALNLVPLGIAINLNALMTLDNDRKRSVLYAVTVFLADVVLDLANVLFFHLGMLGMALATSLSSVIGLIVLLLHFRKEGHLLRFSAKNLDFGCLGEATAIGMGHTINQLSATFRSFFLNNILLAIGGSVALAAFSVAGSAFVLLISVFSSILSVTGSVMNLSYGEEDLNALKRTLGVSIRTGFRIGAVFDILFFAFAVPISRLFLRSSDVEVLAQAARFVRCYAVQNLLVLLSYSLGGSFMGLRRVRLNYLLCVLRDGVYPVACAAAMGFLFGLWGVEAGIVISGVLTLATCFLIPWFYNRKFPASVDGFLLLPEHLCEKPEEQFEASIHTAEEVASTSQRIQQFCTEQGVDSKTAMFVSLFVEEMAGNAVQHGFQGKKGRLVELRLIMREDKRLIRLRDNGAPFDPVKWLEMNKPESPEESLGIRMVIGLAKSVDYLPAMGLNQILVKL